MTAQKKKPSIKRAVSDTRLQVAAVTYSIVVTRPNVPDAAFERVKQDESDNRGEIYFRAMRSRPTRPVAGNRDVGLPPQGKGVWLELIKHLKGSVTLTSYTGSLTLLAEDMEKHERP